MNPQGIRTLDLELLQPYETRTRTVRCETCDAPTREGKPRCSTHVLELPYAACIARTWDAIQTARAGRPLPPEVLDEVRIARAETASVLGIAKIASLPSGVVEMAARALGWQIVRGSRGRREFRP